MPWCRHCKMEYVEGITTCSDCGEPLVESLEEIYEPISFLETEKELLAKKFVDFLIYSEIPNVSYNYDKEKKKWIVWIDESTKKQVAKLYNAFYSVEITGITEDMLNSARKPDDEESLSDNEPDSLDENYTALFDEDELEEILESRKPKEYIPPAYVKKEDQFKDLKSTAFTFFFVSILGLLVLLLNAIGIINIFSGIYPYVVMGIMFIAFLYVGFSSLSKSKRVEQEISSELDMTESIEKWLMQNITKEQLDALDTDESNPEVSFLKKLDYMKELILEEFGEMDESYLDHVVEEYYNTHFETSITD